jgi:hypothetical protein
LNKPTDKYLIYRKEANDLREAEEEVKNPYGSQTPIISGG